MSFFLTKLPKLTVCLIDLSSTFLEVGLHCISKKNIIKIAGYLNFIITIFNFIVGLNSFFSITAFVARKKSDNKTHNEY